MINPYYYITRFLNSAFPFIRSANGQCKRCTCAFFTIFSHGKMLIRFRNHVAFRHCTAPVKFDLHKFCRTPFIIMCVCSRQFFVYTCTQTNQTIRKLMFVFSRRTRDWNYACVLYICEMMIVRQLQQVFFRFCCNLWCHPAYTPRKCYWFFQPDR